MYLLQQHYGLQLIISLKIKDEYTAIETWAKMEANIQIKYKKYFYKIVELCKQINYNDIKYLWKNTYELVQRENIDLFMEILDSTNAVELCEKTDKYVLEYVLECIIKKEIKFSNLTRRELIKGTGKIDEYLTPEKIKKLELNVFEIAELIKATGRIEEYLTPEKIRKLRLNGVIITELIKQTGEIEKYLFKWQNKDDDKLYFTITNVIIGTRKIEEYLTLDKIKELELDDFIIIDLIKETGEIEKYLTPEKISELGLSNYEITELIKQTENIDKYLFKWQNKENEDLYFTIANVIKATGRIEEYLTPEKIKELGLKEVDVIILKENITNIEYNSKNINLPVDMTIGVEIESEGKNSEDIIGCHFIEGWYCKYDGSLKKGVEVVSPILTGNTEETSNSIKKICHMLEQCKQTVSENCGGHIHIGANYLTTNESWSNLIEIWGNAEEIFYIISNKEGEVPRNGIIIYAIPISSNFEKILNEETIQLNSVEDIQEFAKKAQQHTKYSGINFQNIGNQKNTIEFRLSNGTIDENTWIENINLFGGLVVVSEKLTKIKEKAEKERTEEEKEMLQLFEDIKNGEITQEEKAKSLIKLIIPEDEREIYIRRYQKNSELIKNSPRVKKTFENKMTQRKFLLKKDIGKKIFTGDNQVNGIDYIENEEMMMENLKKKEKAK